MDEATVDAVRAFNRFYTRIIGLLDEGVAQSPFTLPEARVLFEVGRMGHTAPNAIARTLGMDPAQLSRLHQKLVAQGLLAITPSSSDRRRNQVALTREGDEAVAGLDAASERSVADLIAELSPPERRDLVGHMRAIEALLSAPDDGHAPMLVLRPHAVGELGWLIYRQAALYNSEYGWNGEFESLIARLYADFESAPPRPPKGLWVADDGNGIAGSVYVVPSSDESRTAQLRMLYVEPRMRGQGLGGRLVGQAVAFARGAGYERMILWTQDCLTAARRVYERAGFTLMSEAPHHAFGKDLIGQYWEMALNAKA